MWMGHREVTKVEKKEELHNVDEYEKWQLKILIHHGMVFDVALCGPQQRESSDRKVSPSFKLSVKTVSDDRVRLIVFADVSLVGRGLLTLNSHRSREMKFNANFLQLSPKCSFTYPSDILSSSRDR